MELPTRLRARNLYISVPVSLNRAQKKRFIRGVTVIRPPKLCIAAYVASLYAIALKGSYRCLLAFIRFCSLDSNGVYFASAPLPYFCRKVVFQGCRPPSTKPPCRKLSFAWFSIATETFSGMVRRSAFCISAGFCVKSLENSSGVMIFLRFCLVCNAAYAIFVTWAGKDW